MSSYIENIPRSTVSTLANGRRGGVVRSHGRYRSEVVFIVDCILGVFACIYPGPQRIALRLSDMIPGLNGGPGEGGAALGVIVFYVVCILVFLFWMNTDAQRRTQANGANPAPSVPAAETQISRALVSPRNADAACFVWPAAGCCWAGRVRVVCAFVAHADSEQRPR